MFESFGFKYGIPLDADLVFDVRCLPNPHYDPRLRPLTGRDQPVIDFLQGVPEVGRMSQDIHDFVANWLPAYVRDNRSYLTVAIGCTGGQHRSVYTSPSGWPSVSPARSRSSCATARRRAGRRTALPASWMRPETERAVRLELADWRRLRPGDVPVAIGGLLVCGYALLALWQGGAPDGAVVRAGGKVVAQVDLAAERTIEVPARLASR